MIFTTELLKLTAESFYENTKSIGIGIKSKCKSFDLWSQFLANKNYSSLHASLENKVKYFELNAEKLCEKFRHKNRKLSFSSASNLIAATIKPFLEQVDKNCFKLVSVLKENRNLSLISNGQGTVGFIQKNVAGYREIDSVRFSNYECAKTFVNIALHISGQASRQSDEIFYSTITKQNEISNKRVLEEFRINNYEFIKKISAYLQFHITTSDDLFLIREIITDALSDYFMCDNFHFVVDTSLISDFIDSLSGNFITIIEDAHFDNKSKIELSDVTSAVRHKLHLHFS